MEERLCSYCSEHARFMCAQCLISYCSKPCQIKHWMEHKRSCKRLPISAYIEAISGSTNNSTKSSSVSIEGSDGIRVYKNYDSTVQKAPKEKSIKEVAQEEKVIAFPGPIYTENNNETETSISFSDFVKISSKKGSDSIGGNENYDSIVQEAPKVKSIKEVAQEEKVIAFPGPIYTENNNETETSISFSDFVKISSKKGSDNIEGSDSIGGNENYDSIVQEAPKVKSIKEVAQEEKVIAFPGPIYTENNNETETSISFSDFVKISSKKSCFFFDSLTYIDLPKQAVVQLKVMNISNLKNSIITVRDFNNQETFDQLEDKLEIMSQESCKKAKNLKEGFSPKYGELCLVLNDVDCYWYRAVCFRVCADGEHFYVQFLDYGFCNRVSKDNIMAITLKHLFPTCVYNCRILVTDLSLFSRHLRKIKFLSCEVMWNEELNIYEILSW